MSFLDLFTNHKAAPTALGIVGAAIALSYAKTPPGRRQWFAAVGAGAALAYLGPPIIIPALKHHFPLDWLPSDGSVEGLAGLALGVCGIHLVAGLLKLAQAFTDDPVAFIGSFYSRFRGRPQ